ncbi:winged helix-turn-helix domain-containing protein [Caballeronia calidae]|uniref:winged helix-turn-helix domain-containing protein n=1 Tax=Caballeronia calidae TaxID=1777139 RepID=UPI0009409B54
MREPRRVCLNIGRIHSPRPCDVLAGQIRDAILRGEIPEGQFLPSETELILQTGITRGAVRVALRLLAAEGLLRTRLGRFGGKIVTLPRNELLAST